MYKLKKTRFYSILLEINYDLENGRKQCLITFENRPY